MKRRTIIGIILVLVVTIITSTILISNFNDAVQEKSETVTMHIAHDLVHQKNINSFSWIINENQKYFSDTEKFTTSDIINSFKGTNYIPVINYIIGESISNTTIQKFEGVSNFIQTDSILNNKEGTEIYLKGSAGKIYYDFSKNEYYIYRVKKSIITENYLEEQFYLMINNLGYNTDDYFYSYILENDYPTFAIISLNLLIDKPTYSSCSETEKELLIVYFEENYINIYNDMYTQYIDYFLESFSLHLETIDYNDIEHEQVIYDIKVHAISKRSEIFDKHDRYIWAVNPEELFNTFKELSYPFLIL